MALGALTGIHPCCWHHVYPADTSFAASAFGSALNFSRPLAGVRKTNEFERVATFPGYSCFCRSWCPVCPIPAFLSNSIRSSRVVDSLAAVRTSRAFGNGPPEHHAKSFRKECTRNRRLFRGDRGNGLVNGAEHAVRRVHREVCSPSRIEGRL